VSRPAPKPTTCFVPTGDRWALALHRYRQDEPGALAAILCSGYACNRHFIDFDDRYSLARFLRRRGFDTWVVELRGRGESHPLAGCRAPDQWTFDDLAHIDVPAAIEYVRQTLGHGRIAWVGHSMGGMVLYAHLGTAARRVAPAALVTLGSPVVFPQVASDLAHRIGSFLLALPFPGRVPQRAVLGALWHLVGRTRAVAVGMNPANVDHVLVGRALRRAITNVSRAKLRQLAGWASTGRFASVDGSLDYRQGLRRVETPTLVVAGACDQLATPETVAEAHERIRTAAKRLLVLGSETGLGSDYGHVDMVLGRHAPDEVFPLIADWLRDALAA
jgi:pimeloyl-ACP methyl ester carboxylesterase